MSHKLFKFAVIEEAQSVWFIYLADESWALSSTEHTLRFEEDSLDNAYLKARQWIKPKQGKIFQKLGSKYTIMDFRR